MKRLILILLIDLFFICESFSQKKPNILWLTIEDTSPYFIGCYGNDSAKTPVIDNLAKSGIRFTNAFSTGTVCSPSRSTIITGVRSYCLGSGAHRSNYPIPESIHGFPYYLRQQGYYTSNNYKTDYNFLLNKQFMTDTWDESSEKADWTKRKNGQPFFAVFNFMESHQSRKMTWSYDMYVENILSHLTPEEQIGENSFELPPYYHNSPEMRKCFARVYNSIKLTDERIGTILEKLDKDNLRDSTIIFFFADHGEAIPRGKTNGINLGYRTPFIIWIPEMYKHLSPWGRGAITDEVISFEDLAPTLISITGGVLPDYLRGRTILGEKRSKPTDYLMLSNDRADNGPDMTRSITDGKYMYSRYYMPFMPEMRYIRYFDISDIKNLMRKDLANNLLNDFQKSLFEDRPHECLYDIENDKWELNNLANDSKYKGVLRKMQKQLDEKIHAAKDIHFLPEYEIALLSATTNAYEYRMDKKLFPFKDIYKIASLSGIRNAKTTQIQINELNNKNEIVRYWAILGLRSQHSKDLTAYRNEIIQSMSDNYLPVAATAAAIAYQEFKNAETEEKLRLFCNNDNVDIALMAINYLLYIDDKQPFVETVQLVHKKKTSNYNVKAACMDFLGSLEMVPNTFEFEN